jgi:hypothetical protein
VVTIKNLRLHNTLSSLSEELNISLGQGFSDLSAGVGYVI